MITGRVDSGLVSILRLRLRGSHSQVADFEALVDTGFNGELSLPRDVIAALDLPPRGGGYATLADGNTVAVDMFAAWVLWEEQWREISVVTANGAPLLGMQLLEGHRLTIEVTVGGELSIQPLPS